jgi:hypothetical protein
MSKITAVLDQETWVAVDTPNEFQDIVDLFTAVEASEQLESGDLAQDGDGPDQLDRTKSEASADGDAAVIVEIVTYENGSASQELTGEIDRKVGQELVGETETKVDQDLIPEKEREVDQELSLEKERKVDQESTPEAEKKVNQESTPEAETKFDQESTPEAEKVNRESTTKAEEKVDQESTPETERKLVKELSGEIEIRADKEITSEALPSFQKTGDTADDKTRSVPPPSQPEATVSTANGIQPKPAPVASVQDSSDNGEVKGKSKKAREKPSLKTLHVRGQSYHAVNW